jgi:hypothetical protein
LYGKDVRMNIEQNIDLNCRCPPNCNDGKLYFTLRSVDESDCLEEELQQLEEKLKRYENQKKGEKGGITTMEYIDPVETRKSIKLLTAIREDLRRIK